MYLSDRSLFKGTPSVGAALASSIVSTVLLLLFLLALVIFFVRRSKKTTTGPVVKEEDNPDYGTYYYADGDRRQDVMEVNFYLSKWYHCHCYSILF